MNDYLVICEYADGGAIKVVQVFDSETSAKEYAKLKQRNSRGDLYYAVKKI